MAAMDTNYFYSTYLPESQHDLGFFLHFQIVFSIH